MRHVRKTGKQSFIMTFSARKSIVLGCATFVGLKHALMQSIT